MLRGFVRSARWSIGRPRNSSSISATRFTGSTPRIAAANDARIDLVIAGHAHKFSYTAPTDAQRYHLLVVGQDQVARVDATATELKVVVTATDGKVVHTLTIPVR